MISPAEQQHFDSSYPSEWETCYMWMPAKSITGQLLWRQDAYKRLRNKHNADMGYEYATLLDILTLGSK
jgi:hypothetical protein